MVVKKIPAGFKKIFDGKKYGDPSKRYKAGTHFYGTVGVETINDKTIISGASFEFTNKVDFQKFINRLQKAKQFF